MNPTRFSGRAALLLADHVDTDQIIPARFLKTTSREGLGAHAFHDWRYDASGRPIPGFVLNRPGAAGRRVLVAGENFGCGSSREHAPWALVEFGFRAVVARSFADIFRQNALKNGLLPVALPPGAHACLVEGLQRDPEATVTIDLAGQVVAAPGCGAVPFAIDAFARECLLAGVDELGYVLAREAAIAGYEAAHPAAFDTRRA